MTKLSTVLLIAISFQCFAQESGHIPQYRNSVVLEFASPIVFAEDAINNNNRGYPDSVKSIFFPATFISGEFSISKKFYVECAAEFGSEIENVWFSNSTLYKDWVPFGFYAGCLFKQRLCKNLFVTPSVDIYYSQVRDGLYDGEVYSKQVISLGPTLGFEYCFSKRFSLSTDILNLNLGFSSASDIHAGFGYVTVYKVLSLGFHYNFNWKKS